MNEVLQNAYKMADAINELGRKYERIEENIGKVEKGTLMLAVDGYNYKLDQLDIDSQTLIENIMETLKQQKENTITELKGITQKEVVKEKPVKKITQDKPMQARIGHTKVDDLNVDEVREFYYREGETQKTTAKHFNVGQNALAKFLADNGIKSKPGGNQRLATQRAAQKKREEMQKKMENATRHLDENEVFNLIAKQGMTYKEVADHFGIDKKMLHRYCEEHNIYNPSYRR